jgi:hypothetical protein
MVSKTGRTQVWTLAGAMILFMGTLLYAGIARAGDEMPAQEEGAAAADTDVAQAAGDAIKTEPPPEPERIEGKLVKVDTKKQMITVLVPPDTKSSNRAFRKYKLSFDDKSLVLVDQQPSTIDKLEEGVRVAVGYFEKGGDKVVDTVVVLKE